ncbi:trimeric intracellular cation channel family protein [Namhaeicola litoreus]|uniref:Trimeric intracellular cation channel family protein n=1 Tax=Namhaeicola litoreus TaxID=1052145 RepID=A0ABW3Y2Q6_9FLAO
MDFLFSKTDKEEMNFFHLFDILGTAAFAISGASFAMEKKMDPFGVLIIGFVTAIGGGTLRDMLVGREPVSWMTNIPYIYTIIISVILAIIFRKKIGKLSKSLFLFDTIGLGIFTITGTEIGMQNNFNPIISISLGMMSATFGGVIRDTLCNEIPLIFHKEIYATACILGAMTYLMIQPLQLPIEVNFIITIGIVIAIRTLAVVFKWSLPSFYKQ